MIAILDYGLGNVAAFSNVYKRLNIEHILVTSKKDLEIADRIILPGVGSFDYAVHKFNGSGLRDIVEKKVLEKKVPILGICVGMQMMAKGSDEGKLEGLNWLDAHVKRFNQMSGHELIDLPHMGWNDVNPVRSHPLFNGLEKDARFYFLHSYYFSEGDFSQVLAQTDFNGLYTSAVYSNNIFGVQFHPEKSHRWGIQLLKNFAELSIC